MSGRPLLPGEHALLGLLRTRPMHGYEMARYFENGLGDVCPLEPSLLYAYLKNLEQRGLVHWEEERVGARPPRKRFDLTAAGRSLVDAWLREPVHQLRQIRLEFLVKLYVLHELDRAAEQELVAEQIAVVEGYREAVATRLAGATDNFERLVAGSKLAAAQGTLTWLRLYLDELREPNGDAG